MKDRNSLGFLAVWILAVSSLAGSAQAFADDSEYFSDFPTPSATRAPPRISLALRARGISIDSGRTGIDLGSADDTMNITGNDGAIDLGEGGDLGVAPALSFRLAF
jgi:hypothetical protein